MSNTRVIVKGGFFADRGLISDRPKKNPFANWFD